MPKPKRKDLDGLAKNFAVVAEEWRNWAFQMKLGVRRFRDPSLKPGDKGNVFHLLVNLIEETYDCLPRTLTYVTIVGVPAYLIYAYLV